MSIYESRDLIYNDFAPRSPSSATLPITTSSDSGIMAHRGGGKGVNLKLGIATSHAK